MVGVEKHRVSFRKNTPSGANTADSPSTPFVALAWPHR